MLVSYRTFEFHRRINLALQINHRKELSIEITLNRTAVAGRSAAPLLLHGQIDGSAANFAVLDPRYLNDGLGKMRCRCSDPSHHPSAQPAGRKGRSRSGMRRSDSAGTKGLTRFLRTWLALTLLSRAIRATNTPGSDVCSTTDRFHSDGCRRFWRMAGNSTV